MICSHPATARFAHLPSALFDFTDVDQFGKGEDLCPTPSAFPQYRDDTRLFKLSQHVYDHGQTGHTCTELQQGTRENRLIKQAVQKRNGVARMGEMEDAEESIRIIETASLQLFQRRFVLTNGLFCNSVTAKSYTRCDND
ncbi:MAG: hypothetical protein AUK26_11215 [Syntrophaceae bacterium CG2_30_58_14]|nr:MAG: hypothetical protein AUK26_11215 [Syntrophaceae bacterium CG2_30_58_14]